MSCFKARLLSSKGVGIFSAMTTDCEAGYIETRCGPCGGCTSLAFRKGSNIPMSFHGNTKEEAEAKAEAWLQSTDLSRGWVTCNTN